MVIVGRVARPHGIRGEVSIEPETDFPDERFAEGAVVFIEDEGRVAPLTVASFRMHAGRALVRFEPMTSMNDAERLRGHELRVPESALAELPENVWYHHELIGSLVRTTDGHEVGRVTGIQGPTERSILVIQGREGEVLVPLVAAFCQVDVAAREIEIDPPEGLLEVNRGEERKRRVRRGAGGPADEN